MRVGGAEHQILYTRQALDETIRRALSEARVVCATLPECRAPCARGRHAYAFSRAPAGTTPVVT